MATAAAIAGVVASSASSRSSSRRAADAETRGQDLAAQQVQMATRQARGDAIPLFESAQQNALAGFGSSLDLLQQIAPQQQQFAQQGNIGARETLLGGQQQFQNAILGGNVDLSGLRRDPLALPDASLFQQQLPEFTSIGQALETARTNAIPGFGGGGVGVGGQGGGGLGGAGGTGGLPQDDGRFFDFNFFNPNQFAGGQ